MVEHLTAYTAARAAAPPRDSNRRSMAKAISWRIVGSIDTLVLSFFVLTFLGPAFGIRLPSHAAAAHVSTLIAMTELVTKIALYFLHERAWARIGWGIVVHPLTLRERRRRSAAKTVSWRVLASLDTTMLALIFTGNIGAAMSIGSLEVITKFALYFLHERAWARIGWGLAGTV